MEEHAGVLSVRVDEVITSSKKTLLSAVNVDIHKGEMCAIMGASGAGKTTLMRILNQTSPHTVKGTVQYQGSLATVEGMRRVSYMVPCKATFMERWTVRETLRYYCCVRDKVDACLHDLGMSECDGKLVEALSTGQRKRLQIGIGLLIDAEILLLDEPTSGLSDQDAIDVVNLCAAIRARQKIVIMVIHQPCLEIFQQFDRVLCIHDGTLVWRSNPTDLPAFWDRKGLPCPHPTLQPMHLIRNVGVLACDKTVRSEAVKIIMAPSTVAPTPPQSTILTADFYVWKRMRLWVRLNARHGESFVGHFLLLMLTVILLGSVFATDIYGDEFTIRAQMLYMFAPFNIFAIVAFKKSVHWCEAIRTNHDVYYDLVSPLTVWWTMGWVELAYGWFLAGVVVLSLRYYDDMNVTPTVVITHWILTCMAFQTTMLVRTIITNLTVRMRYNPTPDLAMYLCCFVELLMEGFNGLFVTPFDMNPRIAWFCYWNPMYYVMLGIVRVEGYDDMGPDDGATMHRMLVDVWIPCLCLIVALNGVCLVSFGGHVNGYLASS